MPAIPALSEEMAAEGQMPQPNANGQELVDDQMKKMEDMQGLMENNPVPQAADAQPAGKLKRTMTWVYDDTSVPPSVVETTTDGEGRLTSEITLEKDAAGDYTKVRSKHTIEYYANGQKKHEEFHTYTPSGLDTGDYHSYTKIDYNDKGQETYRVDHTEGDGGADGTIVNHKNNARIEGNNGAQFVGYQRDRVVHVQRGTNCLRNFVQGEYLALGLCD